MRAAGAARGEAADARGMAKTQPPRPAVAQADRTPRPVGFGARWRRRLRLGLNIGYWAGGPPPGAAESVAEAERLGFDSMWTAEAYGSDVLTPLAWWGAATERLQLGTAIAQISARTPAATAMAAMTMDHLCGGRFILGLGCQGPQVVEGWYGQRFDKPLARMREYIGILREIWARQGPVTAGGPHYPLPLPGTGLGKPLKSSDPPAARGHPGLSRGRGAEEHRDGGRAVRRLARAVLLAPPRGLLPRCAGRGVRPARRAPDGRGLRGGGDRAPDRHRRRRGGGRCAAADVRPVLRRHGRPQDANFHANVAIRMGYEAEVAKIQDLYLDGKQGRGGGGGPDRAARAADADRSPAKIRHDLEAWRDSIVTRC